MLPHSSGGSVRLSLTPRTLGRATINGYGPHLLPKRRGLLVARTRGNVRHARVNNQLVWRDTTSAIGFPIVTSPSLPLESCSHDARATACRIPA